MLSSRAAFFLGFPVPLLRGLGRAGGVIALGLALFCGIGGFELLPQFGLGNGSAQPGSPGVWSPAGVSISWGLMLISPFLAVQGLGLLLVGRPKRPGLSDEELLRRLRSPERPLTVCLDCRTLSLVPPCDHCGQRSSCLELLSAADVQSAVSLLGLEPRTRLN